MNRESPKIPSWRASRAKEYRLPEVIKPQKEAVKPQRKDGISRENKDSDLLDVLYQLKDNNNDLLEEIKSLYSIIARIQEQGQANFLITNMLYKVVVAMAIVVITTQGWLSFKVNRLDKNFVQISNKINLLTNITIRATDLEEVNLREIDLSRLDLNFANLKNADLRGADLSATSLRGADLRQANLILSNLAEVNLAGANLAEADLRGANLIKADLGRANLAEADLTDVNLIGTDLRQANLKNVVLTGALIDQTTKFPEGFDSKQLAPI